MSIRPRRHPFFEGATCREHLHTRLTSHPLWWRWFSCVSVPFVASPCASAVLCWGVVFESCFGWDAVGAPGSSHGWSRRGFGGGRSAAFPYRSLRLPVRLRCFAGGLCSNPAFGWMLLGNDSARLLPVSCVIAPLQPHTATQNTRASLASKATLW